MFKDKYKDVDLLYKILMDENYLNFEVYPNFSFSVTPLNGFAANEIIGKMVKTAAKEKKAEFVEIDCLDLKVEDFYHKQIVKISDPASDLAFEKELVYHNINHSLLPVKKTFFFLKNLDYCNEEIMSFIMPMIHNRGCKRINYKIPDGSIFILSETRSPDSDFFSWNEIFKERFVFFNCDYEKEKMEEILTEKKHNRFLFEVMEKCFIKKEKMQAARQSKRITPFSFILFDSIINSRVDNYTIDEIKRIIKACVCCYYSELECERMILFLLNGNIDINMDFEDCALELLNIKENKENENISSLMKKIKQKKIKEELSYTLFIIIESLIEKKQINDFSKEFIEEFNCIISDFSEDVLNSFFYRIQKKEFFKKILNNKNRVMLDEFEQRIFKKV